MDVHHPKNGMKIGIDPTPYEIFHGILRNGFVWKCWVNIPNEIAISNRDNDQQNHWV